MSPKHTEKNLNKIELFQVVAKSFYGQNVYQPYLTMFT